MGGELGLEGGVQAAEHLQLRLGGKGGESKALSHQSLYAGHLTMKMLYCLVLYRSVTRGLKGGGEFSAALHNPLLLP